jgi:hypothetical protein
MSENIKSKGISRRDFLKLIASLLAFFSVGGITSLFSGQSKEKVVVKEESQLSNSNKEVSYSGYGGSKYGV